MQWMMMFSGKKWVYSKSKQKGFYFKINFITLTLPTEQPHSDTYIVHHLLRPFLKYLNRKHNVINYLWKAEIQPKRLIDKGERCLHFHVTTNKFVHWSKIRNKWNSLLKAHGYIGTGDDPNSTDVHSVVKEKAIISYMAKYLTKEPEQKNYPDVSEDVFKKMFVTCKTWGMNHELSRMKATIKEEDNTNFNTDTAYFLYTTKAAEIEGTHCTIYLHKLDLESRYPTTITQALTANYHRFLKGDDGQQKYTIE